MPDPAPVYAPVPAIGADSESWASRPSIFSFAVHRPDGSWLDESTLRRVHQRLARDVSDLLPADATTEQRAAMPSSTKLLDPEIV